MSNPEFEIIPATALTDVELLRPVLESAVVHPITREIIYDEVEDILASVPRSVDDEERKFTVVAWSERQARVLGMMGLMQPDSVMQAFTQSPNPIELTNAYVLAESRGSGVGRALLGAIEEYAQEKGHTEVILNSGPRFRLSGWPFWRRMYGEPIGIAQDYYGPRLDAPVWRKQLEAADSGEPKNQEVFDIFDRASSHRQGFADHYFIGDGLVVRIGWVDNNKETPDLTIGLIDEKFDKGASLIVGPEESHYSRENEPVLSWQEWLRADRKTRAEARKFHRREGFTIPTASLELIAKAVSQHDPHTEPEAPDAESLYESSLKVEPLPDTDVEFIRELIVAFSKSLG